MVSLLVRIALSFFRPSVFLSFFLSLKQVWKLFQRNEGTFYSSYQQNLLLSCLGKYWDRKGQLTASISLARIPFWKISAGLLASNPFSLLYQIENYRFVTLDIGPGTSVHHRVGRIDGNGRPRQLRQEGQARGEEIDSPRKKIILIWSKHLKNGSRWIRGFLIFENVSVST